MKPALAIFALVLVGSLGFVMLTNLGSTEPRARTNLPSGTLANAQEALRTFDYSKAYELGKQAVSEEPMNVSAQLVLGTAAQQLKKHQEAITAFTEVLKLEPKRFEALDRRGDAYLMTGQFNEAVADFDAALALQPQFAPQHWRRGIALYYANKYAEGVEQFETHKLANPQDVENAVWHYLCNIRVFGKEKAQSELIDVTRDPRVPMAEIQKLFAGKLTPDDVLARAEATNADAAFGKEARFYAHLYVGLWYEAEKNEAKAKEHITTAAEKYKISHYMWDVAKIHAEQFQAEKK